MIRISNISKSYGATRALDDVSLFIDRSEVVSIIGPSGSGKSTLLNCIAGLESYDSGSIHIDCEHRGEFNGVGMVFQSRNLFPHLNILQNLTLAPIQVLGMSKEQAEEEALYLLDKVGIWANRFDYPHSISQGQGQRAVIARSLMMKPSVLLLDDPTSALDPVATSEVCRVLASLKKGDITIILVTHDIDLALAMSDRIVYMHEGKICEQGEPNEIINNPQNINTKSFVNYCINLVYDIPSSKYDHPELNARIEGFCMKYRLTSSETHSIQLVVEELLNLLPLDNGLRLIISKLKKGLQVEAFLRDTGCSYLSQDEVKDELSYSIISGICNSIEEISQKSNLKVIRLKI